MNRLTLLNLASLLIPLVCIMIALTVIIYEGQRLRTAESQNTQTEQQIAQLQKLTKDLEQQPHQNKVPAVGLSPKEQTDFLNMLHAYANLSHVQMTRYASGAISSNGATVHRPLPPNVTEITSDVAIAGSYNDLRQFLDNIQRAPRLYNLTDLKWTREDKWPTTHLAFTLHRYVGPPDATAYNGVVSGITPLVSEANQILTADAKHSNTDTVSLHRTDSTTVQPSRQIAPRGNR